MNSIRTAGRTVLSAAVLWGAAQFVWTFGPRPVTVHANIYAPLAISAGFLPPPPGGGPPVRHGTATVNGATFNYVIGRSKLRFGDVLSHYEQQFATRSGTGMPVVSAARVEGANAGAVAGLKLGPITHPGDLGRRFGDFSGTGRLAALGEFHVISAFEQQGTVFIDFTPGRDVAVETLMPRAGGDAPGTDVSGVARPPGLQRLLTIEHGAGHGWSRTLIYRADDGPAAAAAFDAAFAASSWKRSQVIGGTGLAHYTGDAREAFLAATGTGRGAVVILVHRQLQQAQTRS